MKGSKNMSWVNLADVYVNKSGDSIAGNLSVGGALTINDGKGKNTTYNVANEITTLRDSVSQTKLLWSGSVYGGGSFVVPELKEYTFVEVVMSNADENHWSVLCFNDMNALKPSDDAYGMWVCSDMHVGMDYLVSIKPKLEVQKDLKTVKFAAGWAANIIKENTTITSTHKLRVIAVYGVR